MQIYHLFRIINQQASKLMVRSVDLFGMFVVNLNLLAIRVGDFPPQLVGPDESVEGISEWVSIYVDSTSAHLRIVVLGDLALPTIVRLVWVDENVEVEGSTLARTHGQHVSEKGNVKL